MQLPVCIPVAIGFPSTKGIMPQPSNQDPHQKAPGGTELLTIAQVLQELQVPRSTFYRWKAIGVAPPIIKLPNGKLRMRRSALDAWLTSREGHGQSVTDLLPMSTARRQIRPK